MSRRREHARAPRGHTDRLDRVSGANAGVGGSCGVGSCGVGSCGVGSCGVGTGGTETGTGPSSSLPSGVCYVLRVFPYSLPPPLPLSPSPPSAPPIHPQSSLSSNRSYVSLVTRTSLEGPASFFKRTKIAQESLSVLEYLQGKFHAPFLLPPPGQAGAASLSTRRPAQSSL